MNNNIKVASILIIILVLIILKNYYQKDKNIKGPNIKETTNDSAKNEPPTAKIKRKAKI